MNRAEIMLAIEDEVALAKTLHPKWPSDVIHGAAIVAEEAGETVKAALDYAYFGKPIDDIRKEAIQTAATCIRLLESL